MLVAPLWEFARRTAQEYRGNFQAAHSQLRVINSTAREMLVAAKGPTGRTTAGKKAARHIKPIMQNVLAEIQRMQAQKGLVPAMPFPIGMSEIGVGKRFLEE
jgi:hypothetical protein